MARAAVGSVSVVLIRPRPVQSGSKVRERCGVRGERWRGGDGQLAFGRTGMSMMVEDGFRGGEGSLEAET